MINYTVHKRVRLILTNVVLLGNIECIHWHFSNLKISQYFHSFHSLFIYYYDRNNNEIK